MTKPSNPNPMMGVVHPAAGSGPNLDAGPVTGLRVGQSVTEQLREFVQKLAEDWTRDGTSGDHPGISRAAFELLERLYPEKPVKKYVVARSHVQFVNWCDERGISPVDRTRVAFVDDPARLAGIAGPKRGGRCEIIITRGSGHHPRFADILEAAGEAGF